MKYDQRPSTDEAPCLESPHIRYVSRKAKGIYANILLDDWFKRTFAELPTSKRLLTLLLQELIPERTIADIRYAPQEFFSISSASWTSLSTKTPTGSSTATPSMKTRTAR